MYNVERYIGECLDSILAQTFQDYEVILVDDCSTDSTFAIAKIIYLEKFDGRLKLLRMEKNSGGAALPRNKGLEFSNSEYVYFMDSDDLITPTALEEMYNLAKNYEVDVVYFPKKYMITDTGKNRGVHTVPHFKNLTEPRLEKDNLAERIKSIVAGKFWAPPWRKLVQRKLLTENGIYFPNTKTSEDNVWTYILMIYAKKILCAPNVVYFYRTSEGSITRKKKSPIQNVIFWLRPIIIGLQILDEFMDKLDFFKQNPRYRYMLLEMFSNLHYGRLFKASLTLTPADIYTAIKKEFGEKLGEHAVLIAQLCTLVNTYQKNNFNLKEKIKKYEEQLNAK